MKKDKKADKKVKIVINLDDLRETVGGSSASSAVVSEGVVPPPAATIMCP
jgi:hypothetical protein